MFAELAARMDRIEEMVRHVVRVGTVVSTDPAAGTARVQIGDADGLVSYNLPVLQPQTLRNKDYAMPDPGEHVVCVFLPLGIEQGFCLGSFYSKVDATPVQTADKRHITFADKTKLEYDRKVHELRANVRGGVETSVLKKLQLHRVKKGNVLFKVLTEKILPKEPPETPEAEDWKELKGLGYFGVDADRMVFLNAKKIVLLGQLVQGAYVPDLIKDEVYSEDARKEE